MFIRLSVFVQGGIHFEVSSRKAGKENRGAELSLKMSGWRHRGRSG